MTYYALFNKSNGKRLVHPKIGEWFTTDIIEAQSMLAACHDYLDSQKLHLLKPDFIIINAETGKLIGE